MRLRALLAAPAALLLLPACQTARPDSARPLIAVAPVVLVEGEDAPSDIESSLTALLIDALVQSEQYLVLNDPETEQLLGDDIWLGDMWYHQAARIAAETTDDARYRVVLEVIDCDEETKPAPIRIPWTAPTSHSEWLFAVHLRIQNLETGQIAASEILHERTSRSEAKRQPQWRSPSTMIHQLHHTPLGEAMDEVLDEVIDRIDETIPERRWIPMIAEVGEGSIVINGGRNQGLEPGMVFMIFQTSHELRDPQTGRLLGVSVEDPLGRVEVTEVSERYASCILPSGWQAQRGMVLRHVEPLAGSSTPSLWQRLTGSGR